MSDDKPMWVGAVADQVQAAYDNKDPAAYAAISFDGCHRAMEVNLNGGEASFNTCVAMLTGIDPGNWLMLAAEGLRRTYNERHGHG